MRAPFTDGWNSVAHLALGILSVWYWPIVPLFALYQFQIVQARNRMIDMIEFFIGWSIAIAAIETRSLGQNRDSYGLVYG